MISFYNIFLVNLAYTNHLAMRNYLLTIFSIMLCGHYVFAQTDRWTIKPGENIDTALPAYVKFHYPRFTQGSVFFRDGTRSDALLDYNLLTEEMQFIAPKGDTLAVTNESTIKYIAIGSDTFFYDKVYMRLIAGNITAKLAKKEDLAVSD